MAKINILDASIYNKIAAGEVVERPYSVVKELLDNSIDSGATQIEIQILNGGIDEITVSDNGCGIEAEDFDKVFLAHATSKIKTEQDLEKIGTLGFRGEALASICSVSKVKLISKVTNELFGHSITVDGGKMSDITEVGSAEGTKITVSKLFYNVPARAKFLKKPKQESSEITNLIARYILINPSIVFTYISDGKTIYKSTGNGLKEAIFVVYGNSATEQIIEVNKNSLNSGITVQGFIGKPTFAKANRTYQTLSINNRFVNSYMVSSCVSNAFEHFLMKNQFPFYVLNLQIPKDKLDVNVHPTKMEVRFENSNEIYGCVFGAVSDALLTCNSITSVSEVISFNKVASGQSFIPNSQDESKENIKITPLTTFSPQINDMQDSHNANFSSIMQNNENTEKLNKTSNFYNIISNNTSMKSPANSIFGNVITNKLQNTNISQNTFENNVETASISLVNEPAYKNVGTIFSTYILIEQDSTIYIIDQHAGHERILYDKLVTQVNNSLITNQTLLFPFILNVNTQEAEFMEQNINNFEKLGFDISQFSNNSYKVNAVPSTIYGINLTNFFNDVLSNLSVFKKLTQSDLIIEKLMQHSCKNAVKAGDKLSENEIQSLLSQIGANKTQLQCPHGRPIVVELTKLEIEKWFKRII